MVTSAILDTLPALPPPFLEAANVLCRICQPQAGVLGLQGIQGYFASIALSACAVALGLFFICPESWLNALA